MVLEVKVEVTFEEERKFVTAKKNGGGFWGAGKVLLFDLSSLYTGFCSVVFH